MIIQFSNHLDLSYFFSVTLPTPSMLRSKERRGGFHNCLFHPLTSQFHLFFPFFSFDTFSLHFLPNLLLYFGLIVSLRCLIKSWP